MTIATLLFSDWIALIGLAFSILSASWIGVFQYSKLIHEIKTVKNDVHKVEVRMETGFEKFEMKFQRMDEKFEMKFQRMDDKFEKMEEKFDKRFEQLDNKIEKLRDKLDTHIESHDH